MHYKFHAIDVKNALKNYIWLLEDTSTKEVVVVDPTEASLVSHFCEQQQLQIKQIWLTHWHRDHTEGVQGLLADQNISVYGPRERPEKLYTKLIENLYSDKPFPLFEGSVKHERSFTYVGDIVDGLVAIIGKEDAVNGEIMIERKKSSIATFAAEYVHAFEYFPGRVQIVTKS